MLNISYGVVFAKSYSLVYPELNELSVPSAVQTIILSINIEGKWNLPDNSNSNNSKLTIPNFPSQNNGTYKFYINNWSGIEVCAIQINLTTTTAIKGAYAYSFLNLVHHLYIYIQWNPAYRTSGLGRGGLGGLGPPILAA